MRLGQTLFRAPFCFHFEMLHFVSILGWIVACIWLISELVPSCLLPSLHGFASWTISRCCPLTPRSSATIWSLALLLLCASLPFLPLRGSFPFCLRSLPFLPSFRGSLPFFPFMGLALFAVGRCPSWAFVGRCPSCPFVGRTSCCPFTDLLGCCWVLTLPMSWPMAL